MVKLKLGQSITAMSGKQGGSVFRSVGGRTVLSNKRSPTNRYSVARYRNKRAMAVISQAWKEFPESVRQEWHTAFMKDTFVNISGRGYVKSAFSYFKRYNYPNVLAFGTVSSSRPLNFNFPYPSTFTGVYNRATDTLTITASPGISNNFPILSLWISKAKPSSSWNGKGPFFYRGINFPAVGTNHIFANTYAPIFGTVPAVGQAFSAKLLVTYFQQANFPIYQPIKILVT